MMDLLKLGKFETAAIFPKKLTVKIVEKKQNVLVCIDKFFLQC